MHTGIVGNGGRRAFRHTFCVILLGKAVQYCKQLLRSLSFPQSRVQGTPRSPRECAQTVCLILYGQCSCMSNSSILRRSSASAEGKSPVSPRRACRNAILRVMDRWQLGVCFLATYLTFLRTIRRPSTFGAFIDKVSRNLLVANLIVPSCSS